MKRWHTGFNSYWFQAHIHLEELPLSLIFLETIVIYLAHFAYYNRKLGDFFYCKVEVPVLQWIWKRTKMAFIPIPYKYLADLFPEVEKELDCFKEDKDDPIIQENRKKMEGINKEYLLLIKKLENLFPIERKNK